MIPPSFLYLRFWSSPSRRWGLWIPIILFWPLLPLAAILALPFLVLASFWNKSRKNAALSPALLLHSYMTLCSMKGFSCNVADTHHEIGIKII